MATIQTITRAVLNLVGVGGKSVTSTYQSNPSGLSVLTIPAYRDHLEDIHDTRSGADSQYLIQKMLRSDPDMSAALNAFLTVANTDPVFLVRGTDTQLDSAGQKLLVTMLAQMEHRSDYSTGFQMPRALNALTEACRYMLLMRGGIAGELILNSEFFPVDTRLVDLSKIEWREQLPGQYKPRQRGPTGYIELDIPTFFTAWFRKDPTSIYSYSPFISAINTISARTQVINDLYRIMTVTGYPRLDVSVLEEVVLKNMPADIANDNNKKHAYVESILGSIKTKLSSLRPDESFIHTDSIKTDTINNKSPGMSMDITPIISTLNAQNQAALKTMATIIGRGESGVNTASVEARVFAMSAQALNDPVAIFLSQLFTLGLRLQGSASYVECYFLPVEMRSATELEAQLLIRQQRLKDDLSLGLISDDEYHLAVYNRLAPPGTPKLSGTGFAVLATNVLDTTAQPGANDPVSRAAQPPGKDNPARDKKTKSSGV